MVFTEVPTQALARAVVEVKGIAKVGTMEALALVSKLPLELAVHSAVEAKATVERLRSLGVGCHLRLEFL